MFEFQHIDYMSLNSRQQENYNFQKVSAILADYGFSTMRLTDDWGGADFIAQYCDGKTILKVQLKSACTINKKYLGKDIYMAFPAGAEWCVIPHDYLVEQVMAANLKSSKRKNLEDNESWASGKDWFTPRQPQKWVMEILKPYVVHARLSAKQEEADES